MDHSPNIPATLNSADNSSRQLTDPVAIYRAYARRLLALALSKLNHKLRQRIEAEDLLQSVFRSFFRDQHENTPPLSGDDLWKLLSTIALNKLRSQYRFHTARKRSFNRESGQDKNSTTADATGDEPNPTDVIATAEELAWLLKRLDADQRRCLELRLEEREIPEIAVLLNKSERTIRRWLTAVGKLLEFRWQEIQTRSPRLQKRPPTPVLFPPDLVVRRHEDFVLEQLCGAGVTSKVYRAREIATGQTVCLKILRQSWKDHAEVSARYLHEAKILCQLKHPAIIAYRGIGQMPNGSLFLVLDWIAGTTLAQFVRSPDFQLDIGIAAIEAIAGGLQAAHQTGITHGDINAGNALIASERRVILTDFAQGQIAAENPAAWEAGVQDDLRALEKLREWLLLLRQ